jgi:hypothetical protein
MGVLAAVLTLLGRGKVSTSYAVKHNGKAVAETEEGAEDVPPPRERTTI